MAPEHDNSINKPQTLPDLHISRVLELQELWNSGIMAILQIIITIKYAGNYKHLLYQYTVLSIATNVL